IPALEKVGSWVNTGQTYGWMIEGKWGGHGAQIATSTLLWVALPLTLGLVRTLRREVRCQYGTVHTAAPGIRYRRLSPVAALWQRGMGRTGQEDPRLRRAVQAPPATPRHSQRPVRGLPSARDRGGCQGRGQRGRNRAECNNFRLNCIERRFVITASRRRRSSLPSPEGQPTGNGTFRCWPQAPSVGL